MRSVAPSHSPPYVVPASSPDGHGPEMIGVVIPDGVTTPSLRDPPSSRSHSSARSRNRTNNLSSSGDARGDGNHAEIGRTVYRITGCVCESAQRTVELVDNGLRRLRRRHQHEPRRCLEAGHADIGERRYIGKRVDALPPSSRRAAAGFAAHRSACAWRRSRSGLNISGMWPPATSVDRRRHSPIRARASWFDGPGTHLEQFTVEMLRTAYRRPDGHSPNKSRARRTDFGECDQFRDRVDWQRSIDAPARSGVRAISVTGARSAAGS